MSVDADKGVEFELLPPTMGELGGQNSFSTLGLYSQDGRTGASKKSTKVSAEEKLKKINEELAKVRKEREEASQKRTGRVLGKRTDYSKVPKKSFHHPKIEYLYGEIMYSPYLTPPLQTYSKKTFEVSDKLKDLKRKGLKFEEIPDEEKPYDAKSMRNKFIKDIANYNPGFNVKAKQVKSTSPDGPRRPASMFVMDTCSIRTNLTAEPKTLQRHMAEFPGGPEKFRKMIPPELASKRMHASAQSLDAERPNSAAAEALQRFQQDFPIKFFIAEPGGVVGTSSANSVSGGRSVIGGSKAPSRAGSIVSRSTPSRSGSLARGSAGSAGSFAGRGGDGGDGGHGSNSRKSASGGSSRSSFSKPLAAARAAATAVDAAANAAKTEKQEERLHSNDSGGGGGGIEYGEKVFDKADEKEAQQAAGGSSGGRSGDGGDGGDGGGEAEADYADDFDDEDKVAIASATTSPPPVDVQPAPVPPETNAESPKECTSTRSSSKTHPSSSAPSVLSAASKSSTSSQNADPKELSKKVVGGHRSDAPTTTAVGSAKGKRQQQDNGGKGRGGSASPTPKDRTAAVSSPASLSSPERGRPPAAASQKAAPRKPNAQAPAPAADDYASSATNGAPNSEVTPTADEIVEEEVEEEEVAEAVEQGTGNVKVVDSSSNRGVVVDSGGSSSRGGGGHTTVDVLEDSVEHIDFNSAPTGKEIGGGGGNQVARDNYIDQKQQLGQQGQQQPAADAIKTNDKDVGEEGEEDDDDDIPEDLS